MLPTPLSPGKAPLPFRCLRSPVLPSILCGMVTERVGPTAAPWTVTKSSGLGQPSRFQLQGILRDLGTANPTGFSVTNRVVLRIE